jgi:hypothetical protein
MLQSTIPVGCHFPTMVRGGGGNIEFPAASPFYGFRFSSQTATPPPTTRKAPPVRAGLSCRAAGYHMPLGVGCARGQHHQKRRHPLAGLSCGSYKSNTAIPMIMAHSAAERPIATASL